MFDTTHGWVYVLGVGVLGGMMLRGSSPVRVDEKRLGDFVNEEKIVVREEAIRRLLVDICRQPEKYATLVIST